MTSNMKAGALALATVLIWGAGFPFTRAIGDQIDPYALVFIRNFTGALVLIVIGRYAGLKRPFHRKDHLWFFLAGILGFSLYTVFFNMGLQTLDSASASVISSTCPIFTALGAMKLYKEKINAIGWVSILTAFIGVAILLMWDNGFQIAIGALWIFLLSILFAGYNLLTRHLGHMGYSSMEITSYALIWGAIQSLFFAPAAIREFVAASPAAMASSLFLGFFATAFAYFFWAKALSLTDKTSKVANYIFLNPLMATVFGFLLLKEVPTAATFAGGIIIVTSVITFSLKGSPAEKNRS